MEELLHGPVALINKNDAVFILDSRIKEEHERLCQIADFLTVQTDNIIFVSPDKQKTNGVIDLTGYIQFCELTMPIEYLVILQIIAMRIADCLGNDVTIYNKHSASKYLSLSYED